MKLDPFIYRATIKIMWGMYLILVPFFILFKLAGWILSGIGNIFQKIGRDFNDYWMETQIKLAKTLKEMNNIL